MAEHGIWLSRADAQQLHDDLLSLWHALTIPGREVTAADTARVRAYSEFFAPHDEDGTIGPWPGS